jgi:hypothetical protein
MTSTLRSYRALTFLSIDCYRHVVPSGRRVLTRLLAITLALSFLTVLVPIAASANNSSSMPCCAGKAGHCDSGLVAKKPPQPKEPMCGLHSEREDDGITIVAEPSQIESHHSHSRTAGTTSRAAESASLSRPCRMDCGACTASSNRQQQRDRDFVASATSQNSSLTTLSTFENSSLLFSSNEDWEEASPRGPPSELL